MENALGEPQTIVLLGGTSDIGRAIVDALCRRRPDGRAGRPTTRTTSLPATWRGRGVERRRGAVRRHRHRRARALVDRPGRPRTATSTSSIVAFGQLVDQAELDDDPAAAAAMVDVNYTGAVSVCLAVAAQFRRQGHGRLVVLSSVAGERVRKANFVYGSSKAGLDGFAQGLGDALAGTGASVLVVRPGFVHSRMTQG